MASLEPLEANASEAPPHRSLHHVLRNSSFSNLSILMEDVDTDIIGKYQRNRNIEEPAFSLLIAAYCLLILVGAAGNSLVVCVVVRKRSMRTARNMFIVNLAVSDLLLCLITMPFTLMEIITKYWPLGRHDFVCKMVGTLQATSIFVSSVSNTAIALDRYQVIVYPTRENLQKLGAVVILTCIWLVSLALASPLYIWRTLKHYDIHLPDLEYIAYCLEEWPLDHGRAYYSIFSLVFQYVVPFITVTVAYSRICRKLRYRYVNSSLAKGKAPSGSSSQGSTRRKTKSDRRMKRTNTLLVCTALIFCISWLPLNIFNIVMDLWNPVIKDNESMLICYAVMHMMGMSSACSNPLLYGWLNDNFRKEFQELLALLCPCVPVDAVRERVGSLKSSVSRRRRRRHKSASGSSAASALAAGGAGGAGGGGLSGAGGAGGGGGGGGGGGRRGGGAGDGMGDLLQPDATSDERCDKEETVMAISGYRRGTDTITTTENGTGMLQHDTEMTTLTRA